MNVHCPCKERVKLKKQLAASHWLWGLGGGGRQQEEKPVRGISANFLPCHMAILYLSSPTLGSQAQSFPEAPSFEGGFKGRWRWKCNWVVLLSARFWGPKPGNGNRKNENLKRKQRISNSWRWSPALWTSLSKTASTSSVRFPLRSRVLLGKEWSYSIS